MRRSNTFSAKCFIPSCPNSSARTPNKVFIIVNDKLKKKWCQKVNVNIEPARRYCCEDHVNLEEDLENYWYWKLMNGRPVLKSTAELRRYSYSEIYRNQGVSTPSPPENKVDTFDLPSVPVDERCILKEILLQPSENLYHSFREKWSNTISKTNNMKLYVVSDGPPSLSVRQALAILELPCEQIQVDYAAGEHMTEKYALMNPQKEIPVLDDDGFYLSESNAILQYICDKYRPDSSLYPKDPKTRAVVNHHLCFNLSTYYANISAYTMAPIFFAYERTPVGLKKVHISLNVFETYLSRSGSRWAAADHITIADFPLINSTMTLEAIGFDFQQYKQISKWYADFKETYPELWKISEDAMKEIQYFAANPPDLSKLNHPIHPTRDVKKND